MNLLVDTHILLWAAGQPEKLSDEAPRLLVDPNNNLIFTAARMWEITIKRSLERADVQVEPSPLKRGLLKHGWSGLMICSEHAIATKHLPAQHKDPFVSILMAKAEIVGFTLLTSDSQVAQYAGPIRQV